LIAIQVNYLNYFYLAKKTIKLIIKIPSMATKQKLGVNSVAPNWALGMKDKQI
tara:strand:+ start:884 stop:1042 length:159 start_codon:yes stop_codon:yes gene_type:complete